MSETIGQKLTDDFLDGFEVTDLMYGGKTGIQFKKEGMHDVNTHYTADLSRHVSVSYWKNMDIVVIEREDDGYGNDVGLTRKEAYNLFLVLNALFGLTIVP